jgi:NhaP-type Na+/H+ or K+/H+ antiporter
MLMQRITPDYHRPADAFITGWFGPIGIGTLFYAAYVAEEAPLDLVWTAGSLMVAASVVVHGLSAVPLSHWYGRRWGEEEGLEAHHAPEQPTP